MRWTPFRITEVWAKFAYVIAWLIAAGAFVLVLRPSNTAAVIGQLVMQSVAVGLAIRSFRGEGESVVPPRAWWRATSRPTAGFVIAGLLALGALQHVVPAGFQLGAVLSEPGAATHWSGLVQSVLLFAWSLSVGIFFLNSSTKLRRQPPGRNWVSRDRSPDL